MRVRAMLVLHHPLQGLCEDAQPTTSNQVRTTHITVVPSKHFGCQWHDVFVQDMEPHLIKVDLVQMNIIRRNIFIASCNPWILQAYPSQKNVLS